MTRYILLLCCLTATSLKAQTFTDVTASVGTIANVGYGSVDWGDYDNDGDLDLLMTGLSNNYSFSRIYRNKGDGTFEDSGIPLDAVRVGSADWGDYDNDGDLDILLTGAGNSNVFSKIYRNKGDGTFEESGIPLKPLYFSAAAWGDYDNDGYLDILMTGLSSGVTFSTIYHNKGDGTFEDSQIPLPGVMNSSVAWGDYDNDGDLDILMTGDSGSGIISKIYRNKGDGTFEDSGIPITGVSFGSTAFGDYDNDGDLDILLTGLAGNAPISKLYRNKGDGSFEDSGIVLPQLGRGFVAWGDYDNDDDLDILMTGISDAGPGLFGKIYRNKGDGTFEDSGIALTGVYSSSVAWGDYDNDGDLDILLTGLNNGPAANETITKIYRNNTNPPLRRRNYSQYLEATAGTDARSMVLSWHKLTDGNRPIEGLYYNVYVSNVPLQGNTKSPMANIGNGYRRVAAIGNAGSNVRYTIKGLTPGKKYYWSVQAIYPSLTGDVFAPEKSFVPLFTDVTNVAPGLPNVVSGSAAWGDYDNDGDLDLLIAGDLWNNSTYASKLYRNKGDGTFEDSGASLAGVHGASVNWGDYDNDGDLDILLTGRDVNAGFANVFKVYRNKADGTFEESGISLPGTFFRPSTWGDYDNDGDLDILLADNGRIKIFQNKGAGTFEDSGIPLPVFRGPLLAWADYDNDGDLDFFVSAELNGAPICQLYRNNGNGTFENSLVPLEAVQFGAAAWGDYDNDGFIDLFYMGSTDLVPVSKLYRNKGDGTFEDRQISMPGAYNSSAAWGDYDNDGHLDLLLTGNYSSKLYRNKGNGTFEDSGIPLPGVTGAATAWGDYDNDGDLDLLLAGLNQTGPVSRIYKNNIPVPNTAPLAPSGLQTVFAADQKSVTLSWQKATDTQTPQNGLNYNLYLSDVAGQANRQPPMSDITNGFRKVVVTGNAGSKNTYTINGLEPGKTYYWSVQSIDASYAGSPFSTAQSVSTKSSQTINFGDITNTYGDVDFIPTASSSSSLPLSFSSDNTSVAVITADGKIRIKGTGTANIKASQAGNNLFWPAVDVSVTITVDKKMLSVTAEDKSITYGETLPSLTYKITGLVPGETETIFANPVKITTDASGDAGVYTITAADATAGNYNFTYAPGKLTIRKATPQISFTSLPSKTYGDGNFNPNASIGNGLPISYTSSNNSVATIINGNIHITGAGASTITAKQAGNDNYNAAPDASETLTVNQRALTLTADDQTMVYGTALPTFTYKTTGLVPGETENVFTTPVQFTANATNAGMYPITPSNATADNYTFNFVAGTLTIQKATQTITFTTLPVKTYGDADFNPGAISNASLQTTYTSSDPNVATIINGNIHITGAGTVTITAMQTGNGNYNAAATLSQQLDVKKAQQTIRFGPMVKRTAGEAAFDPGAIASSGLPISYAIENINLAALNGNLVKPMRAGFTKITATQPGNNNYEAANAITQELEIITTGSGIKVSDAVTPNGDGINDYLLIEGIRQFPDNQLYISNITGKIVFEAKGYNNTNNVFSGFAGSGTTLLSRGVYYYVLFYQGKKQSGFFVLEY